MSIFDQKGRFIPLSEDVLSKFNNEQRAAYENLTSAVAALATADAEVDAAVAANRAAVTALHDAEAEEKKRPKWTRLDETRAAIRQWRHDHV